MKIPMYFDSPNVKEKFNAISLEMSQKYCHVLEFNYTFPFSLSNVEFVSENYQDKFYYPIFSAYKDEYFENIKIPKFILEKVNASKCKILITNIYEGYEDFTRFEELVLKRHNLSWENIVLLSGNKYNDLPCNNIYYNYWEKIIEYDIDNHYINYKKSFNYIHNNIDRKYKLICLQRRPRPHRLALYTELYPYNDISLLTMGTGDLDCRIEDKSNVDNFQTNYKMSFKKFKKMKLIDTLPMEYDLNISIENPVFDYDSEKFYESYLHVVSETWFETVDKQIFFSEKTYKPVMYFQPFVMFNRVNALSEFRSMGFETFPNIINESYDQIKSDKKRFYYAIDSILKFIKQDKKTINNIMKDIFPILTHNYFNLIGRVKNQNELAKAQLIINLYS